MTVQGHRSTSPLSFPQLPSTTSYINTDVVQSEKLSPLIRSILKIRGGEGSESESEGEEDTDDESDDEGDGTSSSAIDYVAILQKVTDVTNDKIIPVTVKYSKKSALTVKNTSISVYQALRRAIFAALEGDAAEEIEDNEDGEEEDDDDGEFTTVIDKIMMITKKTVKIMKRMVTAAFTVPEDGDDEEECGEDDEVFVEDIEEQDETETVSETTEVESASLDTSPVTDFGSYLAEAYGVDDMLKSGAREHTVLGGSLQDALKTARQQARMLLVFIPSERPETEKGGLSLFGGGKKGNAESYEKDRVAIESLLSSDVGKATSRKARKNQGSENNLGSFVIWGAKAGSSEATSAIKQLKVKDKSNKGGKRPILCAVYPAVAAIGFDKMAPKVLAQHHCNPPMKAKPMASWMNTLRKRHGKQYQSMQTEIKELELYAERKEGYIDSVQSDNERKLKEAQEEAERKAREIKEAARQAEIDARRQELQASLPEDVKNGSNVKKIALRFPDGRSGQRGFTSDQPLSVVFNWVDAMFEIERETVILTTLNGKQTFSWNDDETKNGKTLEDAGLNKMTAFRVTEAA